MAIEDLSEAKKKALMGMILKESKAGKNFRQVSRLALKNFNIKLTR